MYYNLCKMTNFMATNTFCYKYLYILINTIDMITSTLNQSKFITKYNIYSDQITQNLFISKPC